MSDNRAFVADVTIVRYGVQRARDGINYCVVHYTPLVQDDDVPSLFYCPMPRCPCSMEVMFDGPPMPRPHH